MKLNTNLDLSQYTDPLFLFSWNGGEIVEIHSPQTFKDKYLETGVFDDTDDTVITDRDRVIGDWINFPTAFNRMLEGNFQHWTFDNMEVQRIRTTAEDNPFNAFVKSRTFVPNASNVENLHEESTDPALVYENAYYILISGGKYFLTLERGQYSSTNLEALERKLYAWKLKAS
jgi:hypothetical protein